MTDDGIVNCESCEGGTYANQILDVKEFAKMPDFLSMQKCSTVAPHASNRLCQMKPRQWRTHLDSLRIDTGLIPGLRISIGGNVTISNDQGGMINVDYSTAHLREGEAFLIFID